MHIVNNPRQLKKQEGTAGWTIPFRKYLFFFSHGQQTKHLLVIGCRALHTHRDGHHCVIEKTVPKRQEQCATNTTRNDITQERIALNYCHGTHHLYTLHFPQTTTQKWTNVRHDAKKRAIFFFSATLGHLCEQNKQVLWHKKEKKKCLVQFQTRATLSFPWPETLLLGTLLPCFLASCFVMLRCDLRTNVALIDW